MITCTFWLHFIDHLQNHDYNISVLPISYSGYSAGITTQWQAPIKMRFTTGAYVSRTLIPYLRQTNWTRSQALLEVVKTIFGSSRSHHGTQNILDKIAQQVE